MKSYRTEQIRNITLLSHGGAGKTSLSEAMLFDSGAINRLGKVEEGNTTSDYDPDEAKRQISINMSLLPCEWKDSKINVIDTPGYADFVGEVKAAIRVADGAVIVICAASGVEVGTAQVWQFTSEPLLPRLIFVNRMDRENADFYSTLEQAQARFGKGCVAAQVPVGEASGFQGVVDLIGMKAYLGPEAKASEVPQALQEKAASLREKLVEAVAETDDNLITKYLEGGELTEAELRQGLATGARSGKIVPVFTGSATQNVGVAALLDAVVSYFPSPKESREAVATNPLKGSEEVLPPAEDGPLTCLVFKTTADPYVGRLSYFRVYSGVFHSDSPVWNSTKGKAERVGQIFVIRGKSQEPIGQLAAGDIGGVAKLAETATGDTLSSKDHPLVLAPIEFPKPVFSVAVSPKTKADLDKLGQTIARLTEEDPTLHVRKDADTNEMVLSGMGESHVEIAAEKMRRKFGVNVTVDTPKVPYKETILSSVKAEYKHKKQTGGHGQYGHVVLEVAPLPRSAGFEFAEKVVGGAVPKNYIPAVEKGLAEGLQEGVLAHYPVVDVKVTLVDGSYHPVDSSEMSFKIASLQAFKKGLQGGRPVLLEPVVNLRVTVPEQFTGDVMGDLNTKRAKVLGMNPEDGTSVIDAQIPLAEALRYATELRSITQGQGVYTMEFSHYEEVPAHVAEKVIAQAQKDREAAEKG
ncbi:MAG: elongation factor G [Chloroflexi bacterium]|nr:elongation factor G [Chloroflexota bacterium]